MILIVVVLTLLGVVPVAQNVDNGVIFSNAPGGCRLYAVSASGVRELPCAPGPVSGLRAAPLQDGETYLIEPR